MDEMKINLKTKVMRGMVSKIISKVILSKLGIKTDVTIYGISVEKIGDSLKLHLDTDVTINQNDVLKLTGLVDDDEEL